ncbi:MAG: GINS complex subunit [Bogoriella megaspora]|nr:MAG: GINS complex subunit [Bogoriella megaspora]
MADIADILNSVSTPAVHPSTSDLQLLTRSYIAERCAPEILPYPSLLMERTMARLRKQIEVVEEQTAASADPGGGGAKSGFRLVVLQTEVERWKWLVRGLLRARIAKIDKYPLHILQQSRDFLSPSELQYLQHHQALLSQHYAGSFLASFPPALQRLDDTAGGISMVDAPDLDSAVFVRALRDVGTLRVEGTDTEIDVRKGDVWVVRWRTVRERVLEGEAELV